MPQELEIWSDCKDGTKANTREKDGKALQVRLRKTMETQFSG